MGERVREPAHRKARLWEEEEGIEAEVQRGVGPAKLTRSGGAVAGGVLSGKRTRMESEDAMSPAQALGYARWMGAEERGWARIDRRAEDGVGSELEEGALASAFELLEASGGAQRLPEALARRLSAAIGVDAGRVRVHVDGRAAAAAALLQASAFTIGEDIYFAAGCYDPESEAGIELIAHEVAHVAQQGRGQVGGKGVSRPGDAHEVEADELARRFLAQRRTRSAYGEREGAEVPRGTREREEVASDGDEIGWWGGGRVAAAASAGGGGGSTGGAAIQRKAKAPEKKASAGAAPLATVVELLGKEEFEPGAEVAAHIEKAGKEGAQVRVKLGALASEGIIRVKKVGKRYVTVEDRPQVVPLLHSLFAPMRALSPVMRVRIGAAGGSAITGYAAPELLAGDGHGLGKALEEGPAALGLRGFEVPQLKLTNKLEHGSFTLATQKAVKFELGGWVDGELSLGMHDSEVTFDATAHVRARGLKNGELHIARDGKGQLRGSATLELDLGDKFTGSATASYENGDVTVKGELGYHSEKFSGKLGLVVADAAQAEQLVRAQIDPSGLMPVKPVVADENPAAKAPGTARKGERAIAGWGALDFAFTDWLTGKALVAYGPTGHLTVMGKIAPPQRLDLMKTPKFVNYPLLPEVKIEASYGLPYIADIHVGIGVSLSARAQLGPIYMTNLAVEGLYSTDPMVCNAFSVTGALRAQAEADLVLDVTGYAGLRILKHSVDFGAGITGKAGIKAYAEAHPTLGYREVANPTAGKQGEYYLKGHLEMAAQPVLELGGRLYVTLDSPWWSPAPSDTWTWPIGSLQYPLGSSIGVGADIDHVVGSGNWPDITFTKPSFDASKFVDTMMDEDLPAKSGQAGLQEKKGSWKGEPPKPPTATPPAVPATAVPATKPVAGSPNGKPRKGKQKPQERKNIPATKEVAERWNAGLEELGQLRKRAEKDPETSAEIHQHLAAIKSKHSFTQLTAERSGDVWLVDAEMNPSKKDIPVKADPKEAHGKEPGKGEDKEGDKGDEKSRKDKLTSEVKKREQTVDRLLRATTHEKEKYAHLAKALFELKQPLKLLHGSIDTASGPQELKMASEDVTIRLKEIDPQLETYQTQLAHADDRREKAEEALDKDRDEWKDRERWEKAKASVTGVLATYKSELMAAVPGATIKFRGSLATGWKGPHKIDKETGAARRFNPSEFDCDAFIEVPSKLWKEELVDTDILEESAVWAKLEQLGRWKRTRTLLGIERGIRSKLMGIEGYKQDAGEPHFDMTLQTDLESLNKLQAGNVYPDGALGKAGAKELEQRLPDGRTKDDRKPGKTMPETNVEI